MRAHVCVCASVSERAKVARMYLCVCVCVPLPTTSSKTTTTSSLSTRINNSNNRIQKFTAHIYRTYKRQPNDMCVCVRVSVTMRMLICAPHGVRACACMFGKICGTTKDNRNAQAAPVPNLGGCFVHEHTCEQPTRAHKWT